MNYKYSQNIYFYSADEEMPMNKMDFTAIIKTFELFALQDKAVFKECIFHVVWGGISYDFHDIETCKGKKNILIWIADELGSVPSNYVIERFYVIFKNHLRKEIPNSNIYPLPLFTPLLNLPKKGGDMAKREYDVFFSGCLNKNRILLLWGLQGVTGKIARFLYKISCVRGFGRLVSWIYCGKQFDFSNKIKNSIIKFTDGFYHGYTPQEYAILTSKAKIVLNPRGFHSTECFRMYEAMAAGCIVLSEELPPLRIYKNIPVIQVKDWSNIYDITSRLLNNIALMQKMSHNIYDYYQRNLSCEGIANYMVNVIKTNKIQ